MKPKWWKLNSTSKSSPTTRTVDNGHPAPPLLLKTDQTFSNIKPRHAKPAANELTDATTSLTLYCRESYSFSRTGPNLVAGNKQIVVHLTNCNGEVYDNLFYGGLLLGYATCLALDQRQSDRCINETNCGTVQSQAAKALKSDTAEHSIPLLFFSFLSFSFHIDPPASNLRVRPRHKDLLRLILKSVNDFQNSTTQM